MAKTVIKQGAEEARHTERLRSKAKRIEASMPRTQGILESKKKKQPVLDPNIPQIKGTPRMVPIDQLRPNKWNYNEQSDFVYEKLKLSIQEFGFSDPLVVRSEGDEGPLGFWEIIGGEHRWKAAKELGYTELPVFDVGKMSDDSAKKLLVILNETKGRPNADILAGIIKDLDSRGVDLSSMPYDRSELDSMISATNFDFATLDGSMGGGEPAVISEAEEGSIGIMDILRWDEMPDDVDARLAERLASFLLVGGVSKLRPWEAIGKLLDSFYKSSGITEPKPTESE